MTRSSKEESVMQPVEPKSYKMESQEYSALLWTHRKSSLGIVFSLFLSLIPAAFPDHEEYGLFTLYILLCVIGVIVTWITCMKATYDLIKYKCPRCKMRYNVDKIGSTPGKSCKHCGLKLYLNGKS